MDLSMAFDKNNWVFNSKARSLSFDKIVLELIYLAI